MIIEIIIINKFVSWAFFLKFMSTQKPIRAESVHALEGH